MKAYIGEFFGTIFGMILILAGIFNWKYILSFCIYKDVFIELFGMTLYRILFIVIGISFIVLAFTLGR